jgi:hypothetical protein
MESNLTVEIEKHPGGYAIARVSSFRTGRFVEHIDRPGRLLDTLFHNYPPTLTLLDAKGTVLAVAGETNKFEQAFLEVLL